MRLSLAVKLISVTTIVFLVSGSLSLFLIGYSASKLGISLGNPVTQLTTTGAGVSIPVIIFNDGFLSIKSLTLQTTVLNRNETLTQSTAGSIDISPQSMKVVPVTIVFDFKTLNPETLRRLAFNNENLTVSIQSGMSLEPLVSLQISTRTLLPWGAPLSDFEIGEPALAPYNSTSILASVPISFVNNSPYIPVLAYTSISIYDEANILKGIGALNISAPPGTQYQKSLGTLVRLPYDMQSLMFNDTVLNYRADIRSSVGNAEVLNISKQVEVNWGAPIHNLKLGTPSFMPLNLTHVTMAVPFNFTNNSQFIELDASMETEFYNSTGSLVGLSNQIAISAPAKTCFSGSISGPVRNTLGCGGVLLKLHFTTYYGKFTREMTIGA